MASLKNKADTTAADEPAEILAPLSVPDSVDDEGGKIKVLVQLLKKCLGVADIATMRVSLPASMLEPVPNLEFSQYLDRPDIFAAINDYDDPFERMLAVTRWTLTKDLKYMGGKVCKCYNSVLGEHFRSHWDFQPLIHPASEPDEPPIPQTHVTEPIPGTVQPEIGTSDNTSIRSGRSSKSNVGSFKSSLLGDNGKSPSTATTTPEQGAVDDVANRVSVLNLNGGEKLRVVYLTEQISHHPPMSAYYGSCPDRHLELLGVDQMSARLSGTIVKISAGAKNKGMFVRITGGKGAGETYRYTHPHAHLCGLLRARPYVTVAETSIITCTSPRGGKQFRTVVEYKEQSWLGKAHFLMEGVIHTVLEGDSQHEEWAKVKHVPPSRIVAVIEGNWRQLIRWKRVGTGSYPTHTMSGGAHTANSSPSPSHTALPSPSNHSKGTTSKVDLTSGDSEWKTLLDLRVLSVVPKQVRPLEKQGARESRKMWENVTTRLLRKEFSEATKEKLIIEQRQREEAAERKRKGIEHVPRFFEKDIESGMPTLTEEGKKTVEEEMKEDN